MDVKAKSENTLSREIVTERIFSAPRSVVFSAFTDASRISQWWGPRGFRTTTETMTVKPGGIWKFTMHGPDGTDYPNYIRYTDVIKDEYLAYDHGTNEKFESDIQAFKNEITFSSVGQGTKVTMRLTGKSSEQIAQFKKFGAVEGGQQTLQRLDEMLRTPDSFVTTRIFDAPRELVYQVWTDPKHLQQWSGPKGCVVEFIKAEIREGGVAHSCMTMPDGSKMWGKAIYREFFKPSRIVYIQSFSDEAGGITRHPMSSTWPLEMQTTVIFEPFEDNKTRLTLMWTPVNPTEEERATFEKAKPGMEQGWGGSFEQLVNYLHVLA